MQADSCMFVGYYKSFLERANVAYICVRPLASGLRLISALTDRQLHQPSVPKLMCFSGTWKLTKLIQPERLGQVLPLGITIKHRGKEPGGKGLDFFFSVVVFSAGGPVFSLNFIHLSLLLWDSLLSGVQVDWEGAGSGEGGKFIQTSYCCRGQVKTWLSPKQAGASCQEWVKEWKEERPAKTFDSEYSLPKLITGMWKLMLVLILIVF